MFLQRGFGAFAVGIFQLQLVVQLGVFERDRGLAGQQFQHFDPVRGKYARRQAVFQIQQANQPRLFQQRQAEHGFGTHLLQIRIIGKLSRL